MGNFLVKWNRWKLISERAAEKIELQTRFTGWITQRKAQIDGLEVLRRW